MGLLDSRHRDRLATAAALIAPSAACAILVPFRPHFPNADAALILVTVVVAVAANGHRAAGLLAAASAAVWFDFFLTQPYERFTITRGDDIRTTALLLAVGAAVTELAVRGRRLHRVTVTDAAYLSAINDNAELIAAGDRGIDWPTRVAAQLDELLGGRGCRYETGSRLGSPPRLEADGRLRWGEGYWDVDGQGFPRDDIEIRVTHDGDFYGRFVLKPAPGTAPSREARLVAAVLAGQAGSALARRGAHLG